MARERRGARLALGAALLVAAAAALLTLAAPPAGPVEPAWDQVACAHCRMLVSDPTFAAQLHTRAGEVHFFDDPGCLLAARERFGADAAGVWFHDSGERGWLAEAEARFVHVAESPMGYGFAAVRAGSTPDALDAAAVRAALGTSAESAR